MDYFDISFEQVITLIVNIIFNFYSHIFLPPIWIRDVRGSYGQFYAELWIIIFSTFWIIFFLTW